MGPPSYSLEIDRQTVVQKQRKSRYRLSNYNHEWKVMAIHVWCHQCDIIITICYVFVLLWSLKSKGNYHYESDKKACQNVRFVNWNAEKTSLKVLKYSQLIYYIYDRKWKMDEGDSKRWNYVDGLNWVMDNDYRNISFFSTELGKPLFFSVVMVEVFFLKLTNMLIFFSWRMLLKEK